MDTAAWELSPTNAQAGDETPLLILDREDGPEGRTICVIPGNLSRRIRDGDVVRLLDEQDLANARAILLLPQLRAALTDLTEWAARTGGWDAPCWRTAEDLLRRLRSISPHS
jgi:hypothetical protein